ncbi:hypothetical protein [Streptomyces sp. SID5910]|nr:hypothetical protein [Streptomyces sp. SID5910]
MSCARAPRRTVPVSATTVVTGALPPTGCDGDGGEPDDPAKALAP